MKIINMRGEDITDSYEETPLHPFHLFLIEQCGVGFAPFRLLLDNISDDNILESIDDFLKEKDESNI